MKWGAYAMAGDVGGVDASQTGMIAAAATALGAAIGSFGLWLANRMLGKAAVQTAINTGFKELLDQIQKERERERLAHASEIVRLEGANAQLRGEVINLTQALESLKAFLRRKGLDVPETHSPAADFVILDGDKP